MDKFLNIEHYLCTTKNFKNQCKRAVSTVYATQGEINKKILEGRLFYELQDGALFIFVDEIRYWNVMLMVDAEICMERFPENLFSGYAKPCLFSIVKRKDTAHIESLMNHLSCRLENNYISFLFDTKKSYNIVSGYFDSLQSDMEEKGYKLLPFDEKFRDEIHIFWEKNLPHSMYSKEEWDLEKDVESLFLCFDTTLDEPKLIGVNYLYKDSSHYISTGTAVDSEYRHDMVGLYMQAVLIKYAYEKEISFFYAWIADDNRRALANAKLIEAAPMRMQLRQFISM